MDMLRAGYAKVYVPQARVIHSHDYSLIGWLRRSFDEARALRDVYGYVEPADIRRNALIVWGKVGADLRWVRAHGGRRSPALIARSLAHHLTQDGGRAARCACARLPEPVVRRLSLERRGVIDRGLRLARRGAATVESRRVPSWRWQARFRPCSGGDPGHRRSRREQDVPRARRAQAHAQGARAAPAPPHPLSDVPGAQQRLVRASRAESSSGSPAATGAARARCSSASPGSTERTGRSGAAGGCRR